MSQRRVVITGLGVISPLGIGKQAFWEGLCNQRVGIKAIDVFDVSEFACQVGGQVNGFKINQYIPRSYRKAAKLMARDIGMAVAAADMAVRDAGLVTKGIDPENPQVDPVRLGTDMGAGLIDIDLNELGAAVEQSLDQGRQFSYDLWGKRGMAQLTPLWLLKFLPNMLACHIGIIHDAQGPSNTVLCGDVSSHQAIGEAFHMVSAGAADICISGAANSKIAPLSIVRLELMGQLNIRSNGRPDEACRPFNRKRYGCVPAESAGIFTLEEVQYAQARGAKIYAELSGSAATRQGDSATRVPPSVEGLARAIRDALDMADCQPQDVDLVIPHGVGGLEEDLSEAQGIKMGLGEEKGSTVPVLPIQGCVGNSCAASGALDLAAGVLSISEGTIPAATNCPQPCSECGLNIVQTTTSADTVNVALLTGYATGGQSAAVVIKRFVE